MGNLLVAEGHLDDDAMKHLKIVLKYRLGYAVPLNNIGLIHESRNECGEAEKCCFKALKDNIRNTTPMYNLVEMLKAQSRIADAFHFTIA